MKSNTPPIFKSVKKNRSISVFDNLELKCSRPKQETIVDRATGEVVAQVQNRWEQSKGMFIPTRCTSNSCWSCAVMNARRCAGAIQASQPSHTFSMTNLSGDRRAVANQVIRVFADARKTLPSLRYSWSAEPNPSTTGAHLHGYVHSVSNESSLIVKTLTSSMDRITLGNRGHVGPVPSRAGVTYFAYPMKSLADPDSFTAFLDLNGSPGRRSLVHASKQGFWRTGADGETCTRNELEVLSLKAWPQYAS